MIKTFWTDPVKANQENLGGELPTARGSDPNIDLGGSGAGQFLWDAPPVAVPSGEETANSVSGLPMAPQRYQPSDTPPALPTLQDRQPGTVGKS